MVAYGIHIAHMKLTVSIVSYNNSGLVTKPATKSGITYLLNVSPAVTINHSVCYLQSVLSFMTPFDEE